MVRQAAERAAINGPLQGSAADIIKIAMIKIDDWINHNAPEINMILQVHDELVYEVPDTFSDDDLRPILDLMENTTEIDVPLKVEYVVPLILASAVILTFADTNISAKNILVPKT